MAIDAGRSFYVILYGRSYVRMALSDGLIVGRQLEHAEKWTTYTAVAKAAEKIAKDERCEKPVTVHSVTVTEILSWPKPGKLKKGR